MLSTSDKSFLKFASEAFSRSILLVGRACFSFKFALRNYGKLAKFYADFLNFPLKTRGLASEIGSVFRR
jgi:hypothetical protein